MDIITRQNALIAFINANTTATTVSSMEKLLVTAVNYVTPIDPIPKPTSHMNGGISDDSTASKIAGFWKEIGLKSIRIWVSFDANGAVDENKLLSVNAYLPLGIIPRILFTPDEGLTVAPAIPAKAIASIIKVLDKRVQINLVNEANWSNYWPGNDWRGAFKWANQVAGQLKAAGFVCGSPSFVGWVSSWENYWSEIVKNGWHTNFGYAVFHNYPNTNCSTNPTGWLNDFKTACETAKKIAEPLGLKVDFDEWGMGKNVPDNIFATVLPPAMDSLVANSDSDAYFIVTRSGTAAKPKDPHDYFNWCIDLKDGTRRQVVIDAFKAVNGV